MTSRDRTDITRRPKLCVYFRISLKHAPINKHAHIFACYHKMLCVRTSPTYYMLTNISDDSTIIHNPVFERAIVKLQGGCVKDLTAKEKRHIRRFETSKDEIKRQSQLKVSPGTVRRCSWMSTEENKPACLLQSAGQVSFD
jgi:hypothetical protein